MVFADADKEERRLRRKTTEAITALAEAMSKKLAGQAEGKYAGLVEGRLGKAQRAYGKALSALEKDELEEAFYSAQRGLLHLELYDFHQGSMGPTKGECLIDMDGDTRESIGRLSDALLQFKQLVEYRNLDVSAEAKEKLGLSAQYLQDSIEAFATGDNTTAEAAVESGLVWLSFASALVVGDSSEFPRALMAPQGKKDLGKLLAMARDAGMTLARSAQEATTKKLKANASLYKYLDSALEAFIQSNGKEMSKYLELAGLENNLLQKTLTNTEHKKEKRSNDFAEAPADAVEEIVRGQTKSLADYEDKVAANLTTEQKRVRNVYGTVAKLRKLTQKHSPDPAASTSILDSLEEELKFLKNAADNEKWELASHHTTKIKSIRREFKTFLQESNLL